jgi:hypothetical protein
VGADALEQAARDYAEAVLHGSSEQVTRLVSPECLKARRQNIPPVGGEAEWREFQAALADRLGRPLTEVRITRVTVRSLTATAGDAEVHFNLPAQLAGNDNWVHYRIRDGRWRVADCRFPIGGNSSP